MTFFRNIRRLFVQRSEVAMQKAIESTRAVKTKKAIQTYDRLLQSTTTNAQLRDRSQRSREREA
jgi:hypothetical protein